MKTSFTLKKTLSSFLLSITFLLGVAQPKNLDDIQEYFWGTNDKYKNIGEVPADWNNESAIVLISDNNHFYNKFKKKLNTYFLSRRVIKLNDQSAIEKFSEFTYPTSYSNYYSANEITLGVRIIKPDGSIKIIDVESESVAETETKTTKISLYGFINLNAKRNVDKSYKLAIPDLEVGDIIDYYFHEHKKLRTYGTLVMDPEENILNSEYNTLDYSLSIHLENDFYLNFQSLNGSPQLKDVTPEKSRDKIYNISSKNIEKYSSKRWLYPLVEYPSTKYQISFIQKNGYYDNVYAYLSKDENEVKSSVSKEEILFFNKRFDFRSPETDNAKRLNKLLKEIEAKSYNDKKKLAEDFYYFLRFKFKTKYLELYEAYKNNLHGNGVYYGHLNKKISDYEFLELYGFFLKKYDIPFSMVYATPRFNGDIKDLIIKEHTVRFLKFKVDSETFYVTNFSNHNFFNDFPYYLEGNNSYLLKIDQKKFKITEVNSFVLPTTKYIDNNTVTATDISLDDKIRKIEVTSVTKHKGNNKTPQLNDIIFYFDYSDSDYKKYGNPSFYKTLYKKKSYSQKYSDFKTRINEERKKKLENDLKDNINCEIEDYKYSLTKLGRFSSESALEIKETYSITGDLIKKVGPNYLVEIGKLIGKQVEISEKEKERKENIYMSYPRSFDNKISINIPEGYTFSGINELNFNVENNTGGFKSTAKVETNKLVIETHKFYTNNYEPNKNWGSMVSFLEAAYQFTQKKILLKKK